MGPLPFAPPPVGAPHWAVMFYWVAVVGVLAFASGAPFAVRAWLRIRVDLAKLRQSSQNIAQSATIAAGTSQYNARKVDELRSMFNGSFDERMRSSVRDVLGDPGTGEMFVAAFKLVRREEIERISTRAAELAVSDHERRAHIERLTIASPSDTGGP